MVDRPDPIAATIGAVVQRLRTERGLSMRALAAASSVSQPFLSKLERGRTLPSLSTLWALAAALGVPPAELLPAANDPATPPVHLAVSDAARAPRARLLTGGPTRLTEVYLFTAEPGASEEVDFEHGGEEFVLVLEGRVLLRQGDVEHRLDAGATLTFDPVVPHRFSVPADSPSTARYLLVATRDRQRTP